MHTEERHASPVLRVARHLEAHDELALVPGSLADSGQGVGGAGGPAAAGSGGTNS